MSAVPKPSPSDRKRHARRDPVTPDIYAAVRARDGGCVGPRLGFPAPCFGRVEVDHVRNGGLSYRGPSTLDNLVCLCQRHHRHKTEHARVVRLALLDYLRRHDAARREGA